MSLSRRRRQINIQNFLKSIELTYRNDCPSCGGKNTFSALLLDGNMIWYSCFRASCKLRGKLHCELSIDVIRNQFNSGRQSPSVVQPTAWVIPDHFISPLQNPQCLAFMRRWGLIEKYGEGLELYYDTVLRRCVFPLRNLEGELKGATGRSLSYSNQPRWYIYRRDDFCPYIVFRETKLGCILVEDSISAIKCGDITSSICILGTNFPIGMYRYLQPFDRFFIALDADATGKAIQLQKELSIIIKPTYILPLIKDIKYYTKEDLEELRCYIE